MERSFLEYSMSVIVSRALPDARDGLKPVQRRILWAMHEAGLRPNRSFVKCARVVGDVMAVYHPHGDSAIYDALVRMAQPFSLRHPLVAFHGNYGSPDHPPAAPRYTECRLAEIALPMLDGIDEETVDFEPNYDGTREQPRVLPSRFPNLLVNGSQGIAVAMATNIPPHNLGEVIDAVLHLLAHPDATTDDLLSFVRGPDFPTGGVILGRSGLADAYRTGRGSIRLRGQAEIEEGRRSSSIVITELPYQVSPEGLIGRIKELIEQGDAGELKGVDDIVNLSAGAQTRLVVSLRRDANPQVLLNNLFRYTPLQSSFAFNMVALVDGVPRTLGLLELLQEYIRHQVEVVTRRSQYRLRKAEERLHIVEGLLRAIDLLDAVIATIRASADRAAAREALMAEPFGFSEVQANHILDMTLARLTRLGRSELETEAAELAATIRELQAILGDEGRLRQVIADELAALRATHAEPRRTRLVADPGALETEDLIDDVEIVVTTTRAGYVKAVEAESFRRQGRGGRGVQGTGLKEEDLVTTVVHTSTHAHLLAFSNRGRVFRLRGYEIPLRDRSARGTPFVNLIPLEQGERVQALVSADLSAPGYFTFVTRLGQVKRTAIAEYDKSRREGFIAISLREDDELVDVLATSGSDDLLIVTRLGTAIRFQEGEARAVGRDAAGVRGVRLRPGDEVVGAMVVRAGVDLVLVTSAGFGKRVKTDQFSPQARGGQGVRAIRLAARRGGVVAALAARLEDEVLLVSTSGVTIRTAVREIPSQGRDATGVRVMSLDAGAEVAAAATVAAEGS